MDLESAKSKKMAEKKIDSPLTIEEIQLIDSTALPSIERHHLRLLAHSLACFKLMANGASNGPLPKEDVRLKWLLSQPAINDNQEFIITLLEQLSCAGNQLEILADQSRISPLELTLEELIKTILLSQRKT